MEQIDVINECSSRFNTAWGTRTEIEWPNTQVSHSDVPFVRFSVMITASRNGTIGPSSKKRVKGFIVVQIFVEFGDGYADAYSLAGHVFDVFENQQFNGVITFAGETVELGRDPDNSSLYILNAKIPFEAM